MQKKLLISAVALALGSAAGSAIAITDLDTATTSSQFYATEIDFEGTATVGGAGLDVQAKIGAGFTGGSFDAYAAFKYSCATSFDGNFLGTDLSVSGTGTGSVATVNLQQGNLVVFNIQAAPSGIDLGDVLQLKPSSGSTVGLKIGDSVNDCSVTYRLYYNDPVAAKNFDSSFLVEASAPIFGFKSGVKLAPMAEADPSTADVAADPAFTTFTTGDSVDASQLVTYLGTIGLTEPTDVMDAGGTPLTASSGTIDVIGTDAKLVIHGKDDATGVFDAITKVTLDSSSGCATSSALSGVIDTATSSATFSIGNTPTPASGYYLCLTADGTTPIPAATYAVTLDPGTSPTGYDTSKVPASSTENLTAGEIDQNGTILQATFTSGYNYQVSRFIFVNRSSSPAPLSEIRLYDNSPDGTSSGMTTVDLTTLDPSLLTIPPYSRLAINANKLLPAQAKGVLETDPTWPVASIFSGGVEFVIGAEADNVEGAYQYLIKGSTVQTVVQMARPVSSYSK